MSADYLLPTEPVSAAAFLAFERASETKHEYRAGRIVPMPPANARHVLLMGGAAFALYGQLRQRPCECYMSQMRVYIPATNLYTYPDLVVVCGTPQYADEHVDTLLNPTVIVEVLSPSTESYDRGKKFQRYRAFPSLREYLLIAQDAYHIDHYIRETDGIWRLGEADGLASILHLPSIACDLALADVYEKVPLND